MSDVMPYPSSVWSTSSTRTAGGPTGGVWRDHLSRVVDAFRTRPDPHQPHLADVLAGQGRRPRHSRRGHLPRHGTSADGAVPRTLKDEVIAGCRRIDRFCVLRRDHRKQLAAALDISRDRITVTGAGYRRGTVFSRIPQSGPAGARTALHREIQRGQGAAVAAGCGGKTGGRPSRAASPCRRQRGRSRSRRTAPPHGNHGPAGRPARPDRPSRTRRT